MKDFIFARGERRKYERDGCRAVPMRAEFFHI
jgi:hypothetical protein